MTKPNHAESDMDTMTHLSKLLSDTYTVLVLGNGLNIQAARMHGRDESNAWSQTLHDLLQDEQGKLPELDAESSTPIKWDQLLTGWHQKVGGDKTDAELMLQKALSEKLQEIEAEHKPEPNLYSRIIAANFSNIISFNLDRRLIQHVPSSELDTTTSRHPFLSRNWRVPTMSIYEREVSNRVWFPYGDSSDPGSIQLGYSNYDARLMGLEDYRKDFMEEWFLRYEGHYNPGYEYLHPPNEVYESLVVWRFDRKIESWLNIFFLAPLVFVGVSLSLDDWPLWWLLHQRARNFVPFDEDDCPATYYLTSKQARSDHLIGAPADIEVVEFETFDLLWEFVLKGIERHPDA